MSDDYESSTDTSTDVSSDTTDSSSDADTSIDTSDTSSDITEDCDMGDDGSSELPDTTSEDTDVDVTNDDSESIEDSPDTIEDSETDSTLEVDADEPVDEIKEPTDNSTDETLEISEKLADNTESETKHNDQSKELRDTTEKSVDGPNDETKLRESSNAEEIGDDGSEELPDNATAIDTDNANLDNISDDNGSEQSDKDEFFGFGKKGRDNTPREFETQRSKFIVPKDEYKWYKKMYDHFDTLDVPQEYKNILCDRYSKMEPELKTMYNDYASRLNCLDTKADGTAYYSKQEGGFKFDYNDDMNNELGAGNTYFHESAHMIDSLKGDDANSYNSASYDGYMSEAIHEDYYNAINSIKAEHDCDDATAQQILSKELKNNPIASNTVSDVFGGVTNNKVHGAYGHWGSYWENRGPDAVGKEAFAEITADRACNNVDSVNFTNKYLPNTVKKYNDIINRRI